MRSKRVYLVLLVLTILGAILRFYKLDWGEGFFFHPDERNIASAVLNLDPGQGDFNPNFFAYGSFSIYLTYAIGVFLSFLTKTNWLQFEKVILIGRGISGLLSTLLIPLVYLVFQQSTINNQQSKADNMRGSEFWGIVATTIATFSVGLIQYAHFSTFEIILTFEYFLVLYFALKIAKEGRWRDYLFCAVAIGVSIATKMTSVLIVPILLLIQIGRMGWMGRMGRIKKAVALLFLVFLVAFALSPYNILDFSSFRGSMDYEGGVATGSLPVFYTTQFIGTKPVWFQLTQVFPYILGWPLTVVGFVAWGFVFRGGLGGVGGKKQYLVLLLIPTFYFGFHSLLFVKWTRYMIPVLPFLIITSVVVLSNWHCRLTSGSSNFQFSIFNFQYNWNWLFGHWPLKTLTTFLVLMTIIYGLSFFSIYLRPDTRVAAAEWASQNIPHDAKILSEVWDMGITAFNPYFEDIKLFDFYELDREIGTDEKWIITENPKLAELVNLLEQSEYIIVPSQRIYGTRLRLPEKFPIGARYYQSLFDASLGFTKAAEFDSQPMFFSEANAEETFKVFDHPKVMIFQKIKPLEITDYQSILSLQ